MKSAGISTTENALEYNGVKYLLNVKGKQVSYSESLIGFMKRTELETMNAAKLSDAAAAKSETALAGKAAPLSEELVKRIKSGNFNADEIQRLSDARRLLKDKNLPALKPEQEQELLLSHYRANDVENKFQRICSKVRPLFSAGLSKEQIKLLGDNLIFGISPRLNQIFIEFRNAITNKLPLVIKSVSGEPMRVIRADLNGIKRWLKVHGPDQNIFPEIKVTYLDGEPKTIFNNAGELMAKWSERVIATRVPTCTPPMTVFDNQGNRWFISWDVTPVTGEKGVYEINFYHAKIKKPGIKN